MPLQEVVRTTKRPVKKRTPSRKRHLGASALDGRAAFLRVLPQLMMQPELHRRWVLFVGDRQLEVGQTKLELIQRCERENHRPGSYFIGYVDAIALPQTVENVDSPNCEVAVKEVKSAQRHKGRR